MHAQARAGAGAARCELGFYGIAYADKNDVDVGSTGLELERGRYRHMGSVIAPHAIDREGDQRAYSPLARTTFLPR